MISSIASSKAERPVMSVRARILTFWAMLLVMTGVSVALAGGHPASNWIYALVGALGVWITWRASKRGDRPVGVGDGPPKSIPRAAGQSALVFVVTFALVYLFWHLLWTERWLSPMSIGVSAMAAVNHYREKRGHDYSSWPTMVVFGVLVLVLFGLRTVGIIGPIHD